VTKKWDRASEMQIDPQKTYRASTETFIGTFELELYP